MIGINRHNLRKIDGEAHLAQSILDILTTPKGSRVMRRDYGSDLPRLIDNPINGQTMIDVYQATAEALQKWEPRIDLARVELVEAKAGKAEFILTDQDGQIITLPSELRIAK